MLEADTVAPNPNLEKIVKQQCERVVVDDLCIISSLRYETWQRLPCRDSEPTAALHVIDLLS